MSFSQHWFCSLIQHVEKCSITGDQINHSFTSCGQCWECLTQGGLQEGRGQEGGDVVAVCMCLCLWLAVAVAVAVSVSVSVGGGGGEGGGGGGGGGERP